MNQVFKAIVIDDEPAARRLMKNLLQEHSDMVEVIAEAGNGREAIQKIEELKPDLIFLDIQMPDLTGFEVIEKLSCKPNIIFTTAYEQYAIKAFESFSIDYLLKPIKEERLKQSIEKLKAIRQVKYTRLMSPGCRRSSGNSRRPPKTTALTIKTGDRIILLRFENISYLEAEDKYVFVFTTGWTEIPDRSIPVLLCPKNCPPILPDSEILYY